MKFIKKVFGKIKFLLYYNYSLLRIIIVSLTNKNRVYLMGIPIHGNLGDQAIVISEREFLKKNFKKYKIIEIESSMVTKKIKMLKKFVGESLIFIHGGGFIGSLWPKEDDMANLIIKNMKENKIIILPQTVYFDKEEEGIQRIKKDREIYEQHENLYICVREKYSYDFMRENFKNCNVFLVPDMVLYLEQEKTSKEEKDNIILCLRNDKEKTFFDADSLVRILNKIGYYNIIKTDTVIENRIYDYNRKRIVKNKINEFSRAKLVITDRLHGMVFAFLANTYCLVINSKSHKVKGVYNWIKSCQKLKLIENMDDFEMKLNEIFNKETNFNREEFIKNYDVLIELINKCLQK